eukprot:512334-Prorocentrum_minimum.AAC.2
MGFVVKDEEGIKYEYEGDFNLEALTAYTTKLVAGELTPYYKSEDIPEKVRGESTNVGGESTSVGGESTS